MLMRLKLSPTSVLVTIVFYGVSQAITLVLSLVRFPLILSSVGQESLSVTLLWGSLQSWALVAVAGKVNVARIQYLNEQVLMKSPSRSKTILVSLGLGMALSACMQYFQLSIWTAGLPSALVSGSLIWAFSASFGAEQAKAGARGQFLYLGIGSLVSLVTTFLSIQAEAIFHLDKYLLVNALCFSTSFGVSVPFILAHLRMRRQESTVFESRAEFSFKKLYENAAVLPPAFINGFDITSLSVTGHSPQIPLYAISSRLALVTTLVPGALYTQVNNQLHRGEGALAPTNLWKLLVKMELLVVLSSAVFIGLSPWLIKYLTLGTVQVDYVLLAEFASTGFMVPIWIVLSSALQGIEAQRRSLGRWVLFCVIPISISTTFLFSKFIGMYGPILASFLVYTLASSGAFVIGRNSRDNIE